MFLGSPTISGMHLLLSGISFAEDYHGLAAEARIGGFDNEGFERWVERGITRTGCPSIRSGWRRGSRSRRKPASACGSAGMMSSRPRPSDGQAPNPHKVFAVKRKYFPRPR